MRPTEILHSEHRILAGFLETFQRVVEAVLREGGAVAPDLGLGLTFLDVYCGAYHNEREEEILFPALSAHGLSIDHGPVAVLGTEHDRLQALVVAMHSQYEGVAADDSRSVETLSLLADEHRSLILAHFKTEEQILYPMVDAMLSEDKQAELCQGMEQFDRSRPQGTVQPALHSVGELRQRHGPGRGRSYGAGQLTPGR